MNDLSQLPPELLLALSAAGGGGIPGLDPNMLSALSQLSSFSNNAQNDDYHSPNPTRTKQHMKPSNNSSSNKNTPSSSSRDGKHHLSRPSSNLGMDLSRGSSDRRSRGDGRK